jgi:thiol-disulfide isomerase/thioredoxin
MKTSLFTLILMLAGAISCKTSKVIEPKVPDAKPVSEQVVQVNYSDPPTWLLGYFGLNRFNAEPHSAWFVKGMTEYSFNTQSVDTLKGINTGGLSIRIVLGTWCPDSRREVPRFMRILKDIDFPADRVAFLGVDNMKIAPIDNYEALGIERVPTFIFYKNNVEIGRIIENPVTSLEQDMVNILTRNEKL